MISLKKQKGFTLVELLIVIIIIGILATLVIVTFTGVQAKARDSKRQTDVGALDSHLEAFFAENGYYPTVVDLKSAAFLTANMKGFDPTALCDPKSTSTNCATPTIADQAPAAGTYIYTYQPTGCDDTIASSATTPTNECTGFTLTAELEAGGNFVKKSNT